MKFYFLAIILIIGTLASFRNDNPNAQAVSSSPDEPKKKRDVETLSKSDAIQFPFIASAALLSLYVVTISFFFLQSILLEIVPKKFEFCSNSPKI